MIKPNYSKLIFLHFAVQRHMYFNNCSCETYGTLYTSDNINDVAWNIFVPDNAYLTLRNFNKISSLNNCGIYLPTYLKDYSYIKEILEDNNYKLYSKESWMIYNKRKRLKLPKKDLVSIKIVDNSKEYEDYKDVFIDAYGGEKTSSSPYGGLDDSYINTLNNTYNSKNHINFVLYYDDIPVSIATICTANEYGGIYCVGTKKEYQGKGFAKYIMKYIINYYYSNYSKYLFLQTESNSIVERFYISIGFTKAFICMLYTRDNYD